MLLSALGTLGKSLLSGRKKKKSKSGKEMSQQVLNRSNKEEEKPTIKPQSSLVPLSIKTTTIPTANLTTTKEDSVKDKLLMIKDLLGLQLKFRLSSFSQKIKNMREERRKKREKELEEKKEKKKKSSFLGILPKTGILDSLKNFLAFLAGGFLLNILLNNLPVLEAIGKKLAPIAKGIMQFGKFMWEGVIGFIVNAYDKYDELRASIERIGGKEALDKFDKVSNLLKKVINGALIMAAIALVAKPFMRPRGPKGPGGGGGGGVTPVCPPVPVTIPQLVTSTITSLQTIVGGVLIPGTAGLLQKLFESLVPTNEQISGTDVKVPDTVPVKDPVPVTDPVTDLVSVPPTQPAFNWRGLSPQDFYEIVNANVFQDKLLMAAMVAGGAVALLDGPLPFGDIAGFSAITARLGVLLNAKKLTIPIKLLPKLQKIGKTSGMAITGLTASSGFATVNAEEIDDDTPTLKITVIGKRDTPRITQWWDLEDEPNFMKNVINVDDLAQDTSYSNGSYGVITNNTTVIQPVVQEV